MDRFVETNNKLDARDHVRNATLRRIRHYLSDRYQRVYPDLKGMCERVSDTYRDRVVVELIQNAHDAHEAGTVDGRIKIVLDTKDGPFGSLTVANDGVGFLQKNFDALCSPTLTTKSVNEAIGNKGVGFLSVFQVSSFPEIYSRVPGSSSYGFDGYCFRFADDEGVKEFLRKERLESDAGDVIANMPRLYLACPLNLQPYQIQRLADEGFATAVRLPLKNIESLASVKAQLAQLAGGDPPIQLFLSRIAEFSIDDGNGEPSILMRHWDVLKKDKSFRLLEVRCDDAKFIVAERTLQHSDVLAVIETDVATERLPESWRKWEGDAVVSLAVTASGEPLKGRFYNFLPMGAEAKSPFDGHLDAPFYASIDRLKLQPGVMLNEMLLAASRELAVEAARAVKNELISNQKEVVSDFLFWHGEGKAKIKETLIATGEALVPVIGSRPRKSWASLEAAKLWKGDDFITPTYAAKVASFPVFDVSIGPKRVDRFLQFASGVGYPKPPDSFRLTDTERTAVLEGVADDLLALRSPIERWNRFYESLAGLFADKPMILAECRILLTARGDLEQTSAPSQGRARRGARLRTVFLPPLRSRDGSAVIETETLPLAVQRRLTYLHRDLGVARDRASAARQFLLSNGLIRDHETREILRLLAGAIVDPGSTADPDALRWSALETIKRIVSEEDSSATMVGELGVSVPTKSGWIRGGDAYFGSWRGTNGGDLQRLFEESTGLSKELDQEAAKLLIPYRDWAVRHGDVGSWVSFLRKVGVADQLRPMPAFSGTPPRNQPGYLSWQLSENAGIGAQQAEIWRTLMGGVANLANPYTTYTTAEAFKVPGQADFANLGAAGGKLFARQVVRLLEERPGLLEMTVYRPQHSHAPNRTNVPSPIAAFVRGIEWVPVAKGGFNKLADSWLPGADGNPPPCISVVEWDFRSLLNRCDNALSAIIGEGLQEYGSVRSAWAFLVSAGGAVEAGVEPHTAERIFAAVQETWAPFLLRVAPPADLRLLGRRSGSIVAIAPGGVSKSRLLVADGDDRQLVAAIARIVPNVVIVEPPPGMADQFAGFLGRHFPNIERAALIEAHYESDGATVAFNAADKLIEEELPGVRDLLVLGLRYRCTFFRGAEEAVHRLSTLRIRWLKNLSFKFEDRLEEVPMFAERAVAFRAEEGSTILVSSALRDSARLTMGISEALGEAVGSRKNVGEPLLALAATLISSGPVPHAEDYARALGVSVREILGVLGTSRAFIAEIAKSLRPIVQLYAGELAARQLAPGSNLATEDDVLDVLDRVRAMLPVSPQELLQRCRENPKLPALAVALDVDLRELNDILSALGPPYSVIDLTAEHEATLTAFLSRHAGFIRESIRASFRQLFAIGEDLTPYRTARDSIWPRLPVGYGLTAISLPHAVLDQWLAQWLNELGVSPLAALPSARESLEQVREANLKTIRALVPSARVAVLAKSPSNSALASRWRDAELAERAVVELATTEGWIDFDRLDWGKCLDWLAKGGLWDSNWGRSLDDRDLGITEFDKAAVAAADVRAVRDASASRNQVNYSGGTFTIGSDSYGALADKISELAGSNLALQQTPTRIQQSPSRVVVRGGGGGTGGSPSRPSKRMPEEERSLIGFFGEMIAFAWLKARFGKKRVIDETCWRSLYRTQVYGGVGDDSLGYDFEVQNGKHFWYFEVKATAGPDPQARQMVELGSTEIARAESCRADGRTHYRILYVTNALVPETARLFVLPNPRSKDGLAFFTEQESAGVRLHFPLPSGG